MGRGGGREVYSVLFSFRKGVEMMQKEYGKGRIAAFISIHAYSQFWMSPYGKYLILSIIFLVLSTIKENGREQ
jgi:hypothetical protein